MSCTKSPSYKHRTRKKITILFLATDITDTNIQQKKKDKNSMLLYAIIWCEYFAQLTINWQVSYLYLVMQIFKTFPCFK